MTTRVRFVLPVVAVLVACSTAHAQSEVAPTPHPALSELVKEYKRLGLPLLPPNAELVRINIDRYTYRVLDEPREELYELAFRLRPAKRGERAHYLRVHYRGVKIEECEYVEPAAVEETEPVPTALRGCGWITGSGYLALAIQCKTRGWEELAAELYAVARAELAEEKEPQTVYGALRAIACEFWVNQRFDSRIDRREVLRRLEVLFAEEPKFRGPDFERLIRDLKLTVAPPKSKPGSVEALIDDLIDYQNDPLGATPTAQASYWKLAELGFDAVPALIEHINDDRLTRAYQVGRYHGDSWNTTVGHLCSRLLFDLSGRTIGGDYRQWRDTGLKPDEAQKWFEKAKKIGEERWLLEHAVPTDDGGRIASESGRFEPHIVRVIGAKYPNRLPVVYRALLKKSAEGAFVGEGYINPTELVLASKLPREQKLALLEEGATSGDISHRVLALEGLAQFDRELLRKHLLATLKRISLRFWLWADNWDHLDRVERLVALSEQQACWDGLAEMYRAMSVGYRLSLFRYAQRNGPPDRADPQRRDYIRFLLRFLDDQEGTREDGITTRVCDSTATQLAGVLGFPVVRGSGLCWPVHDHTRGPFSRAVFRAAVWQAALRELVYAK